MQVEQLLQDYRKQVLPYTEQLYKWYRAKASKINAVASDLLLKFFRLHPMGKMHRGALTVLGYELGGGTDREEAIKASVAVELFATSLLVADDVIDQDILRRGQETIHTQWTKYFAGKNLTHYGESMGLITSIVGLYLAPLALEQVKINDKLKLKALNFLFESGVETGYGEALDISSSYQTIDQKKQSSQFIHLYKTVNYSAVMPLIFGATLAGNSDTIFLDNLKSYGDKLGKIFQIQDDILGSFGDPQQTGKSNESDIKEGRWTVLVEILYNECSDKERNELISLLEKPDRLRTDVKRVKELFAKYDVLTKAQTRATAYLYQGLELIPKLTENKNHQDTLKNLLEFMLVRNK